MAAASAYYDRNRSDQKSNLRNEGDDDALATTAFVVAAVDDNSARRGHWILARHLGHQEGRKRPAGDSGDERFGARVREPSGLSPPGFEGPEQWHGAGRNRHAAERRHARWVAAEPALGLVGDVGLARLGGGGLGAHSGYRRSAGSASAHADVLGCLHRRALSAAARKCAAILRPPGIQGIELVTDASATDRRMVCRGLQIGDEALRASTDPSRLLVRMPRDAGLNPA